MQRKEPHATYSLSPLFLLRFPLVIQSARPWLRRSAKFSTNTWFTSGVLGLKNLNRLDGAKKMRCSAVKPGCAPSWLIPVCPTASAGRADVIWSDAGMLLLPKRKVQCLCCFYALSWLCASHRKTDYACWNKISSWKCFGCFSRFGRVSEYQFSALCGMAVKFLVWL